MRTLALVSQKGGAGKTTLAVHLAVAAHLAGLQVAIADLDPQSSAWKWSERRKDHPEAVVASAEQLDHVKAQAAAGGLDLLVVDSAHLGDGRWFDGDGPAWRDGSGFVCDAPPSYAEIASRGRVTRVVLATAHRNHDTADNRPANLAAWCQRCHMLHDRGEHLRRRWGTLFRRKALGDLFRGPYA